jgi:hypothetical protein
MYELPIKESKTGLALPSLLDMLHRDQAPRPPHPYTVLLIISTDAPGLM